MGGWTVGLAPGAQAAVRQARAQGARKAEEGPQNKMVREGFLSEAVSRELAKHVVRV